MPSTFPQGQAETDSCLENWVNKIAPGGPKIRFGSLPRAQSPPARIRADSQARGPRRKPGLESREPGLLTWFQTPS